jgi:predicted DNA-binding transcriptional regulator AlpA
MANIILQGLTTDQLSEMIRESVRDEISCIRPHKPESETEYLSRKEALALLQIDSSTLWSWEKTGYIHSFPFGGRKRYKRIDIEAIRTGRKEVGKSKSNNIGTASPHSRRQR